MYRYLFIIIVLAPCSSGFSLGLKWNAWKSINEFIVIQFMFRVYPCPLLTSPSIFGKGWNRVLLALDKALPDEVKKGVAVFEGVAAVTVDRTNSLVLSGTVPRK